MSDVSDAKLYLEHTEEEQEKLLHKSPEDLLKSLIAEDSQTEPCVIVVGSQINSESGLPSPLQFSSALIQSVVGTSTDSILSKDDLTELLRMISCHSVILQKACKLLGDEILSSLDVFLEGIFTPVHFYLAKAIKKGHIVISTQFDTLIEKAYHQLNGKFPYILHRIEDYSLQQSLSKRNGQGLLIKFGGKIDKDTKDPQRRYSSIKQYLDRLGNGIPKAKQNLIQQYLTTMDVIVIGYDGAQDEFTMGPLLKHTETEKSALWIFDDPSSIEKDVTDRQQLEKSKTALLTSIHKGTALNDIHRGREILFMWNFLLTRKSFTLRKNCTHTIFAALNGADSYTKHTYIPKEIAPRKFPNWKKYHFIFSLFLSTENQERCKEIASYFSQIDSPESSLCAAEALLELGKFCIADGINTPSNILEFAKDSLQKSRDLYTDLNNVCGKNECNVELIKVQICQRDYRDAMEKLDEIEKLLEKSENYEGIKRHLIQVFIEKGLLYGMTNDPKVSRKNKSLNLLKTALFYAKRLDDSMLISFCLQLMAASLHMSAKSIEVLDDAKKHLEEAIQLSQMGGTSTMKTQQHTLMALISLHALRLTDEPVKQQAYLKAAKLHYSASENEQVLAPKQHQRTSFDTWTGLATTAAKCGQSEEATTYLELLMNTHASSNNSVYLHLKQIHVLNNILAQQYDIHDDRARLFSHLLLVAKTLQDEQEKMSDGDVLKFKAELEQSILLAKNVSPFVHLGEEMQSINSSLSETSN